MPNKNSSSSSGSNTGSSGSNNTAFLTSSATTITTTTTTITSTNIPSGSSPSPSSGTRSTARRQSTHSIIEKRRRERINDKIQQLKEIIPTCNPHSEQQPIRGPSFHQPLHKLAILEAAIAYIEQMHQTLLKAPSPAVQNIDPKLSKVLQHARQCQRQES